MIKNHVCTPEPDTYEGPHFESCPCGEGLSHYHLVDELDHVICMTPLFDKSMMRRAIKKYGSLWNTSVHRHLKREMLWLTDVPEYLSGSETIDFDSPEATQELQITKVLFVYSIGEDFQNVDFFISPFAELVLKGDIFVNIDALLNP